MSSWPRSLVLTFLAVAMGGLPVAGQDGDTTYVAPRTPWGDPDIQGIYTNKDEYNTPMERPEEFAGLRIEDVDDEELRRLVAERQAQHRAIAGTIGGAETGAGPTHWFESFESTNSQPWLLRDPVDGRLPPRTPASVAREARAGEINGARNGEGVANTYEDRSLYDRCITRGLPGSMMPAIYGNAYQIVQAPGYVAIRYEMIHETRVIPVGSDRDRPHLGDDIRQYFGDARGRWDGQTLVVETTNFTDRTHMGYNNQYNSLAYRLVERFTPVAPGRLQWEVTIDDPETWMRPWTFVMPLKVDVSQPIFEYGCHEGNYGLVHMLSGARAEEVAP